MPARPQRHRQRRAPALATWNGDGSVGTVSVTLDEDGGIGMSVSPTDRPVDLLRAAGAVLEGYAANLEDERAPVHCGVCGHQPTVVPMPDAASP